MNPDEKNLTFWCQWKQLFSRNGNRIELSLVVFTFEKGDWGVRIDIGLMGFGVCYCNYEYPF